MSTSREITLRFDDLSVAEQGRLAKELSFELQQSDSALETKVQRDRADTMDLGSVLVLALGTPAITVLAHGIASFLARYRTKATIRGGKGEIILQSISGSDAAKIAESLKALYEN